MSSATKSPTIGRNVDPYGFISTCIGGLTSGVRAIAFWIAALLPLFILGAFATGAVAQHPQLFAGALALNVICAVIGHGHSPN